MVLWVGDHLLVLSVSIFLSLLTLVPALSLIKCSQVSFLAGSLWLQWKRSLEGCSAMVLGNWGGLDASYSS